MGKQPVDELQGREIVATRVYDAPRELVFRMWTDRNHVTRWWGPNGFTTTIHEMDVRPGGVWRFTMHGPDGTDYRNEVIYDVISPPERLEYRHVTGPGFRMIVTFDAEVERTRLTARMIFDTAALRERTIKEFGADEGLRQTLGRLADQLASA